MRIKIVALLGLSVLAFGACKKNEDASTKSKLTGRWKLTQYAADTNGNGSRDASELEDFSALNAVFTFNSNSTGTSSSILDSAQSTFSWELTNADKWIKITDTDPGTTFGEVSYSNIESISSSTLIVKDTAGGISWSIYTK